MSKKPSQKKKTSIGGQALMEGIMMRGPYKTAMCVRRADGGLVVEEIPQGEKTIWSKIPVVRGVYNFVASMMVGSKTLMRSAEIAMDDAMEEDEEDNTPAEELTPKQARKLAKKQEKERAQKEKIDGQVAKLEEKYEKAKSERLSAFEADAAKLAEDDAILRREAFDKGEDKLLKKHREQVAAYKRGEGGPLMGALMVLATVVGVALAVLLFFFLPTWAFEGLLWLLKWAGAPAAAEFLRGAPPAADAMQHANSIWQSIFEGILKLIIFIVYVKLCTLMKEIRTMFAYHGAEHMSIFCYEAGEELTVENVRKQSRFHPRCGTSFLIIMMILGIIGGMFIPQGFFLRPLLKLAVIPLIMGVGYELLKLCGRYDNILTRIISAPGMWMQRLTTYKPADKQIECAIAALEAVIPEDGSDQW